MSIIKGHMDYRVTNVQWRRMDMDLYDYLRSLELMNTMVFKFIGIPFFYFRTRFDIAKDIDLDPWKRRFKTFPPETTYEDNIYTYHKFFSEIYNKNIYVITTTINGMKIYCVDVITNTTANDVKNNKV